MLKQVKERAVQEKQEERQACKLVKSHHAPADWKVRAQMVAESWAAKAPD